MSGVFQLYMMGRFGNMMFSYAFARAYAEKHNLELQTDQWVGENIFNITPNPIRGELPRRCENTLTDGEKDVSYRSYSQQQKCLIYTKRDVQRWFTFRLEIEEKMKTFWFSRSAAAVVAHRRVGDFAGYGYPVVCKESYRPWAAALGLADRIQYITEEEPNICPDVPDEYSFVCDFYRLVTAPILLRGNSSFSWWAGAIGSSVVWSPRIDCLPGGEEHDAFFERGNHCRLANFPFTTDLELSP